MVKQLCVVATLVVGVLFGMKSGSAIAAEILKFDQLQTGSTRVRAELEATEDDSGLLSDIRVQLSRNGQILSDAALPVEQLPTYDSSYGIELIDATIQVIDLDGNSEPEVLITVSESGTDCCSSSFIYGYNASNQNYRAIAQFWGHYANSYETLTDLDGDGSLEFVALDNRFQGEFGSDVTSLSPIQIWRYRQGALVDVTRDFPNLVSRSAVEAWNTYSQLRSDYGEDAAQGAMAAYVATEYLLGLGSDAMQRLQQAYPGAEGQEFVDRLTSFLRETGYAR